MAESKLLKANKKIEEKVVDCYQKIEDTVTGTYEKIEDHFVNQYLTHDHETVEEAKKRLKEENKLKKGKL